MTLSSLFLSSRSIDIGMGPHVSALPRGPMVNLGEEEGPVANKLGEADTALPMCDARSTHLFT